MPHSYQNWYDLVDVQEIVNAMSDEDREKFIATILTPTTISTITEEVTNLEFLSASIDEAKDWSCSSNETWWFDAIYEIDTDTNAKLTELQAMSEATALIIQADIINSDTSWQAYHTLKKQFNVLTEQQDKFCGQPTYTYVGCFLDCKSGTTCGEDSNQYRDLPLMIRAVSLDSYQQHFANNRAELCADMCSGMGAYFGTQAGYQCFCGDSYGNQGGRVDDSECNLPCNGDLSEMCGGDVRNSIYKYV